MAITQVNLPAVYGAVQQHKTGQMQNQLLQMQMDSAKAAAQKQGQLGKLYAEQYGGTDPASGITWDTGRQGPGAMTDKQFAGRVMALDPQAGMALQDHVAKMTQAQREQWKFEAPLVARGMANVKDQQSYSAALNVLGNAGVDLSDLPQEYSPDNVSSMMAIGQEAESFTLSPGQTRYGPGGAEIASAPAAPAKPGSALGKLIADRDALPPNSPLRKQYDAAIAAETQGGGPFGGTGMDAQTMNLLLQGNPNSPEYLAAYNHYAAPKMSYNASGQLITITPDMSAFRPPAGRSGAAQPGGGQPAPQHAPGGGVTVQQAGPEPATKAQDAVDAAFAKDYAEFVTGGGFADAQKNIGQMKQAVDAIKAPGDMYGPVRGRLPNVVRNITNPQAINVQEQIEEVVQRNLRVILGAQFTEDEGKRLIARAFNPNLDDATNAARLERLLASMERGLQAKQAAAAYYESNGTLRGYKGSDLLTIEDLEKAVAGGSGGGGGTIPPPPPGYVLVE